MRVPEPGHGDPATDRLRSVETLPDADLVERMRGRVAVAMPAAQEFRRRHFPAVLAYARLCSRSSGAAAELAARAFTLAIRGIRRGINAPGAWRHRLLVLVQQSAVSWSSDSRRGQLAPGLVACIEAAGSPLRIRPLRRPIGTRPQDAAMLEAFHSLPERTRGVLWHALIEDESDAEVAVLLGVEASAVDMLRASAHKAIRRAYLNAHLKRNGSQTCGRFQRLIEAATEPGDLRRSLDLEQHMSVCSCCTLAVAQLFRVNQDPRGALADALLGWGSAAYLATAPTHVRPECQTPRSDAVTAPAAMTAALPAAAHSPRLERRTAAPVRRGRRVVSAVAVVAAVVAAGVAVLPDDNRQPDQIAQPVQPPRMTVAITSLPTTRATSTPSSHPSTTASSTPIPTPTSTPTSQHPSPSFSPRPRSDVNLAIHKTATGSSHTQTYVPSNAVDGDVRTYWESANHSFPQWFEIDLGSAADVRRLVMALPPLADWNARRQTVAVEGSANGHEWRTVAPATPHFFDAAQGNTVTVPLAPQTRLRYLRLTFTANTGWPAAQLSELQLFTS
ncbi:discoidin domain-containing protein [Streptomyces spinoverrucosus]|uniref:discoidin domain-containing protein n=1 Tax=Streptomyces spinoverrucosus TaxID=284043 RepID=UPI0018C42890|nr:discoidin domain-containing protein [Streptomyces spinoverrucosus]MBG0850359.1 discoidin domain-containing protein [Streptomyces spinoverrucosus]